MPRLFTSRRILFALLAAAWLAAPALAQSGKLAGIRVTGTEKYSEDRIAAASGLVPGQTVTRDDLQAAADRLAQLGPFQDVRYSFSSREDRIDLVFQLADAPAIPVSFDNFPWFTDAELTEALKEQVGLFDGTAPEFGAILDEIALALERLLETRAVKARVEYQMVARVGGEGMMQQFRVVGPSLKVNGVQFEDPLAAENARVRGFLGEIVGRPFSRFTVEVFLYDHVRPLYLSRGHLKAEFGRPMARFTGDPNQPLEDSVVVIVPITPGPVYRWVGAVWSGNQAMPGAQLNNYLTMPYDQPVDGMRLVAAWERVRLEYGRRGYLDVAFEPVAVFDDAAARVSYQVAVREGPVYRMGELVLTGLSLTAERLLREAWRIAPGQAFDMAYFEDFLANGLKPAFGDHVVHYQSVGHLLRKNPQTLVVDVLVDFK